MKHILRALLATSVRYSDKMAHALKINYYKFLFGERVVLGKNILMRRGCSIIFLDDNKKARLLVGSDVKIRQNCIFTLAGEGRIEIDNGVFFNNNCSITSLGNVYIGEDTLFGEGVKIYDHNHVYKEAGLIKNQGFIVGKVIIGRNCWIGSNCVILNNVTIGDNVVIGANTTVFKSIESNVIVYNNSANVQRSY